VARYVENFKQRAVARLLPPESSAISTVSQEMGVWGPRWSAGAQMHCPCPGGSGHGPQPLGCRR